MSMTVEEARRNMIEATLNAGYMVCVDVDAVAEMLRAEEELQQYRAIGTVSEFRELKEKATPKKIGHCVFYREMGYGTPWQCLTCGADQIKAEFSCEDGSEPEEKHTFCWMCGQKLLWD